MTHAAPPAPLPVSPRALAGPLAALLARAGRWEGDHTLHDPHSGTPDASRATLVVVPVLGGRFVRLDYGWAYRGAPQEGSLLVGHDAGPAGGEHVEGDALTGHWIDAWHMGEAVMALRGPVPPADAPIVLTGSYPAPPGPDWGWRITLVPDGADGLRLRMDNLWPDAGPEAGRADAAVEATLRRVG